ncbi:MAG: MbnP family protein [Saprospiraceae bacterium]|nr:MbnP family protein [Saprospiraceae bacterium]
MKHISAFLFILLSVSFIGAQKQVFLNIEQLAGNEPLVMSNSYSTDAGYDLNFTRLQYYISEIFIIHDGGHETKLDGLYILANALEDTGYDLGQVDVANIEGIRFHIGVDEKNNHSDPALWPSDHPLAPRFPTMHWGWAAGYRFAAIEGKAGLGLAFTYQVHALGDQHYGAVELAVTPRFEGDEIHIDLRADYLRLFDGLDVSFGLIEHSDAPKAAQLLTNLKEKVFTAASITSTNSLNFDGEFSVLGNPVSDKIEVKYDLQAYEQCTVRLISAFGQTLEEVVVSDSGILTFGVSANGQSHLVLANRGQVLKTIQVISQ